MVQVVQIELKTLQSICCLAPLVAWLLCVTVYSARAAEFQEPEMVLVPAGTFTMGTPSWADDPTHWPRIPQRRVSIESSFWVGKYEVTRAEYRHCVEDGGCSVVRSGHPVESQDLSPVTGLSLESGHAYTDWLSRKTGKKYRLLTGIEWEYAARGGETGLFATGKFLRADQANFNPRCSTGNPPRWRKRCMELQGVRSSVPGPVTLKLKAVGSYPPNRYGLHDVHGNASELVSDCIVWDEAQKKPVSEEIWQTDNCKYAYFMGGYYQLSVHGQRFDYVLPAYIDTGSPPGGFRVARDE